MDLESIKRLNTPHFCQWYLKRLQRILDNEKRAEYSQMPCESFTDLSKIVEHSQYLGKWDQRARQWVSNNPVIYCHARIAGTDGTYETRELTEDFIESYGIGIVPFFSSYIIKEYMGPDENLSKKVLTPPAESVECPTVETKQEGSKFMSTIKETAIKSKDQVIKTAIGQAGVAGIKSLILTALPMKIGFIGRLLGRHRQVANNSLVVAGVAILANQIGQKYISNDAAKNALQATQDQALTEVLNEYIGIENQVNKIVANSLQLDAQPVTVDQD